MKRYLPFLILFYPFWIHAESQTVSGFRGIHNSDAPDLIQDNEAQDLSNVDLTDSGLGIKKRSGYSQFKTVGNSTWGVRGGYYFRDVSGNDNIIAGNGDSVYYSRTGGNYTAFITTDTAGSYDDFTDSNGYLWRANSNRDEICKWDGTTRTYYPDHPKGNQIEVLPDRLVISGVAANPNRVYFSGAADFTNFTVDIEESSPFWEDFSLPGQSVTAIKTMCGGVGSFTKDTLSLWTGSNQFDAQIVPILPNLGTTQPNSIIQDGGTTYWQAQDKHFYGYDCNSVTRLSQNLNVSGFAGGGESKNWYISSETDWEGGTIADLSSDLSPGDLVLSTWTRTDTTTADFSAFTSSSNVNITNNKVYLATSNINMTNYDWSSDTTGDWELSGFTKTGTTGFGNCGIGNYRAIYLPGGSNSTIYVKFLDVNGNTLSITTVTASGTNVENKTVDTSAYAGRWIKLEIVESPNGAYIKKLNPFLSSGETLTFWTYLSLGRRIIGCFENGVSNVYTGNLTSQSFGTGLSSAAWLPSNATWTASSNTVSIQTQSSDDGSSWDSAITWSTGSAPTSLWKKYIRYVVTLSTGGTTNSTGLPYLEDVTFSARSATGTWTSQTKNIGSGATAFRNFVADETLNGGGISYAIKSTTTEAGIATSDWTWLTKDTQISATIAPWIQLKSTFSVTYATQTPTLSAVSVAWDEGTITHTFGAIDKDHRLMWSVAEGTSTVPNVTYIYDQQFGTWLKYSVPFDAPARVGDSIYFGNPSTGYVYTWPSGNTDLGGSITAYWKSKDFVSGNPFVEKDFTRYSFVGKTYPASNLDLTYTLDSLYTTSVNYSLTDPFSYVTRSFNDHFPSGTVGQFINFKFGNDDADAPFEVHAFSYDYTPRPWRVMQ